MSRGVMELIKLLKPDDLKVNFKPTFYKNNKIIILTLRSAFLNFIYIIKNSHNKVKFLSLKNILGILQLRKNLLLYKIVRFNNQYFSTPTIPAFPSSAYDNMVSKGGLNFLSAGAELKQQIDSVFLAITNKCTLSCKYCYEKFNINKSIEISSSEWIRIINKLQSIGVNIFILTGGEPLNDYNKLIEILSNSNKQLSDFHIHTSGNSITIQKALQLKQAGLKAAAVGLDDFDESRHDKIRGKWSFRNAVKALRIFNDAGILTYVNFCASKEILSENRSYKFYDFVKSLNVSMIQLLEPRPCGGFFNNGFENAWLNETERKKLLEFATRGNKDKVYKNYPLIYYVAHIEGKNQLGCHMGGLSHFYIDSVGNVCPCVFFPVKYGNILKEDIIDIYKRMRSKIPAPIHTDCPSILLEKDIRTVYQLNRELPVSFVQIQERINSLYQFSDSSVKIDINQKFKPELKGLQNEKSDIH